MNLGSEGKPALLISTNIPLSSERDFFFLFESSKMRDLVFQHLNRIIRRESEGRI